MLVKRLILFLCQKINIHVPIRNLMSCIRFCILKIFGWQWLNLHACVLKYVLSENDIGFGSIFVCVGHIDVHGPVSYTRSTHLGACREVNIYSNNQEWNTFCQKLNISLKIVFFPENRKFKKQMNWVYQR